MENSIDLIIAELDIDEERFKDYFRLLKEQFQHVLYAPHNIWSTFSCDTR